MSINVVSSTAVVAMARSHADAKKAVSGVSELFCDSLICAFFAPFSPPAGHWLHEVVTSMGTASRRSRNVRYAKGVFPMPEKELRELLKQGLTDPGLSELYRGIQAHLKEDAPRNLRDLMNHPEVERRLLRLMDYVIDNRAEYDRYSLLEYFKSL